MSFGKILIILCIIFGGCLMNNSKYTLINKLVEIIPRDVKNVAVGTCFSTQEKIKLIRRLNEKGIAITNSIDVCSNISQGRCAFLTDFDCEIKQHVNVCTIKYKTIFIYVTNKAESILLNLKLCSKKIINNTVLVITYEIRKNTIYYELQRVILGQNGNISLIANDDYEILSKYHKNTIEMNTYNLSTRLLALPQFQDQTGNIMTLHPSLLKQRQKYIDTDLKFYLIITKELLDIYKFKMLFVKLNDTGNVSNVNNSWTYVKDGIMDVGIDFMFQEAVDKIDYIMPLYPYKRSFIFLNPPVGDRNIFLRPFSRMVWYSLLFLVALNAIACRALLIVENLKENEPSNLGTTLMITLGVCFQQGTWFLPNLLSGRLFLLNLLIFSILSFNYYTSTVVSSLLNNPKQLTSTIDGLKRSGFRLGFEYDNYPNRDVVELDLLFAEQRSTQQIYFDYVEGIDKVRTEPFAYCTESASKYSYLKETMSFSELCNTFEIDISRTKIYKSVVVPKTWKFKELFKIGYRRLQETGIHTRELHQLVEKKPCCLGRTDFAELSLSHLTSAFIIILIGYISSIIILILEFTYKTYKKSIK